MKTFAEDLATRFTDNPEFGDMFNRLIVAAVSLNLPSTQAGPVASVPRETIEKLQYCAAIFAQVESDYVRSLAQGIAIASLAVSQDEVVREKAFRLLGDLGNFPSLAYAESHFEVSAEAFGHVLRRRMARALNTVTIGSSKIPLTDYQMRVWDALGTSKELAVSAPTSAGKSFLIIEYLCRAATRTSKAFHGVYIAPTRALLAEIEIKIKQRLSEADDIRVSTIPTLDPERKRGQVYILTQERLQALLTISDFKFDFVVVDEAQNLADGGRGMILQDGIEQILQREPSTRIVFLAPGAEGFDDAAELMGLDTLNVVSTRLSPVLQNRIQVSKVEGQNAVMLSLLTEAGKFEIGRFTPKVGIDKPENRLCAVAREFGREGGSLVYATGPVDAELAAWQLSQGIDDSTDPVLLDLAKFIRDHIHPEYGLAKLVLKGIAFHYGKMPSLLRDAIEDAFRAGLIKYLVCTTTLFQGVNLPARNVFIDTPTRGQGAPLDPAMMWNFAGRAGRLTRDIVGNVFLVDYDQWAEKPMDAFVGFRIESSVQSTLQRYPTEIIDALKGDMPKQNARQDDKIRIRSCAGLLISKAANGKIDDYKTRMLADLDVVDAFNIVQEANKAAQTIALPGPTLATNWTINPFGLKRLYIRLGQMIKEHGVASVIPINPHENGAGDFYGDLFDRILSTINGSSNRLGAYISGFALQWMKGAPYPKILSKAILRAKKKYQADMKVYQAEKAANPSNRKKPPKKPDPNDIIRDTFEIIEDQVRFQFVQYGKAYIDLLTLALESGGNQTEIKAIFDFSLALELGIATASGRALIELGLSRIAASALEGLYNSNMSVQETRQWVTGLEANPPPGLSPIITQEFRRLGLWSSDEEQMSSAGGTE